MQLAHQHRILLGAGILIAFMCLQTTVLSCDEVVCGSIVSKCMLTQSCRCSLKNCSCCEECIKCLGRKYFQDCCSCVELCPPANDTRSLLSVKSNIEDFEGVAELFNVLAIGSDYDWDVVTFQIDLDAVLARPKQDKNINYFGSNDKHLEETAAVPHAIAGSSSTPKGGGSGSTGGSSMATGDSSNGGGGISTSSTVVETTTPAVNCTVFYLDQCMSWNKCRQTCKTTGASSCRWFHDGCCECVGFTCINYGMNESRCRSCPDGKDSIGGDDIDDPAAGDEEMYDFGDGVGPMDGAVNNNHF